MKKYFFALKSLQTIQAPVLTDLPMTFSSFFSDLGYFLLRAINVCFENEKLLDSLKRGVIICIPKGNKDKL